MFAKFCKTYKLGAIKLSSVAVGCVRGWWAVSVSPALSYFEDSELMALLGLGAVL